MITMDDGIKLGALSHVSETMWIPLYCRAIESQSKNPIIKDAKSVEIITSLKDQFSKSDREFYRRLAEGKLPSKLPATMALRTRRFDRYVENFLKANPDGIVVSLGCGLDTRFYRLDNGKVEWYEVDLPEVIKVKGLFMKNTDRFHFISSSVLDFSWLKAIRGRGRPVLFYAEGLFMYLPEEEVKKLVLKLVEAFPGAELVCEVVSKSTIKRMKAGWGRRKFRRNFHLEEDVVFIFGVDGAREMENWNPKIQFLDEWTYFDDREKKLGWFKLFGHFKSFKYAQWTAHYKFSA